MGEEFSLGLESGRWERKGCVMRDEMRNRAQSRSNA